VTLIGQLVREGKAKYSQFKDPRASVAKAYEGNERYRPPAVEVEVTT
jgi:hypothetical protein